jgi:hypothetical protein
MPRMIIATAIALLASIARADNLKFKDGTALDCTIIQQSPDRVAILFHSAVLRISTSSIQELTRSEKEPAEAVPRSWTDSSGTFHISAVFVKSADGKVTLHKDDNKDIVVPLEKLSDADRQYVAGLLAQQKNSTSGSRIAGFKDIVVKLGAHDWADGLRQIPATVIDTGVMRNVPYKSFRAGNDYEVNVYGDPESPAGFEIGIRGALLADDRAKANCVDFISSLMRNDADKATVRGLDLVKDLTVFKDLTFEITPPTAEDAYGGWWVSVYSEPALNSVRASDSELKAITVPKSALATTGNSAPAAAVAQPDLLEQFNADDLRYARPTKSSDHSGGSVYVRGYTRKDGTYVHSYTRSAPNRSR